MFDKKELIRYVANEVLNIIYPYKKFGVGSENYTEVITLTNNEDGAKKIEHIINSHPKILKFLRNNFGVVVTSALFKSDDNFKTTVIYSISKSKYKDWVLQSILKNRFGNISEDCLCPEIVIYVENIQNKYTLVNAKVVLDFYRNCPPFTRHLVTIFEIVFKINAGEGEKISFHLNVVEKDITSEILLLGVLALLEIYSRVSSARSFPTEENEWREMLEQYTSKVLGINWKQLVRKVHTMDTREYMNRLFNFLKEVSKTERFKHLELFVAMIEAFGIEFLEDLHKRTTVWKEWLSLK